MPTSDERLKLRVNRAITLQEQGQFVVDTNQELPLLHLPELRYSTARDEYGRYFDFETNWGKFRYDPESYRSLLVLCKGNPPAELLPQPRLELATATVHTGYVSIHNNGRSFDLDFQTRDKVGWDTIRLINKTLAAEQIPIAVWQVDEDDDGKTPIIRIANESAMVYASSAIWSPDDQQLVAAQVVTTSLDLLKAIKASLANNNGKSFLTVKTPEDSAYLRSARKGFITVNNNLTQANAEGTVTAMLHPLSGDPQANTYDHFYLVVSPGEKLSQKFTERLDLAIPWPLQPEWADYLLEAGQGEGLVEVLPSCGDDFAAGLRVVKNETQWQQVITTGLKQGHIHIS